MPKSILLIDDSQTALRHIQHLFNMKNYQDQVSLHYANNALDGLILLEKVKPDLLIMDWHMEVGELDGLQATEIIRQNPRYQDLPILMMSADGKLIDKIKGLMVGVNEFMDKNSEFEESFHQINAFLGLE